MTKKQQETYTTLEAIKTSEEIEKLKKEKLKKVEDKKVIKK